ncbi:MAG: tRNA (guanosine(46)-N7)-methyltransferase TrmB [Bacteroidales bacterium]|nr:tRNA (guanosine(46)-N7)-methyltransferase TrmB [Bacteroidales bacterium]
MPKRKLLRYAALGTHDNVFQVSAEQIHEDFKFKGRWAADYFRNDNPIVLELGCGKGEYSVAMAEQNPHINYIGIDLKGDRLLRGASKAKEKKLVNVCFLRIQIQFIEYFFSKNEVDEIWITFPDPQLQKTKHRKRLCSDEFLHRYKNFLKKDGLIHLKTDNTALFDYALDIIASLNQNLIYSNHDIYSEKDLPPVLNIKTYYELKFLLKNQKIKYLKFSLNL